MVKRLLIFCLLLFSPEAGLLAQDGIVVQDPSLAVRWQTFADPSRPLTWCWDDADAATITCRRAGAAETVVDIERGESEVFGSFPVPVAAEDLAQGTECLFDIELELSRGTELIRKETARLAYLPGIASGGMIVREPGTRSWRKVKEVRVFAHPGGESPELNAVGEVARRRDLRAGGGFDAVLPAFDLASRSGPFTLSVTDGEEEILSADLLYYVSSLSIILK
jgi:hypothetical protein